jgi:hypothetical protein
VNGAGQLQGEGQIEECAMMAETALKAEQYETAAAAFEMVLRARPDHADALHGLGVRSTTLPAHLCSPYRPSSPAPLPFPSVWRSVSEPKPGIHHQVVRLNQDRWSEAHALWRRGVAAAPQHSLLAAHAAKEAAYSGGSSQQAELQEQQVEPAQTFVLHDDFRMYRAPRGAGVSLAVRVVAPGSVSTP